MRGRAPDHPFEEAPRTGVPRRPLERRHVAEQPGGVRRVGQDRERPWIGREPDLADRPERALGHELVQHVERLHGDGEPDTGLEVGGQEPRVAGLAANDAVVAAVEEAHELDLGGAAFAHDATVLAVGALGLGAWRGHEGTPSPCAQRRGVSAGCRAMHRPRLLVAFGGRHRPAVARGVGLLHVGGEIIDRVAAGIPRRQLQPRGVAQQASDPQAHVRQMRRWILRVEQVGDVVAGGSV